MQPRSRRIWLFRVFYEMPTRDIASHPDISLKPGHVDVLLQRCRETIRDCMRAKGHDLHEIPPGTFIEMWRCFEWKQRTAEVDG
jgi:DNA-directed RNA polymerase specialized sigma24 family protein